MPIVHVYMWSGMSREAKEKIIKGITKVFEELGIPRQAVEVVIHEVPRKTGVLKEGRLARSSRRRGHHSLDHPCISAHCQS
jgi:4-oxalocrotonate tautomerase